MNSTCRDSLHEIVFEVWKSLLYQYAHDAGRREPMREDALRAFARLKSHVVTRRLPTIPHSFFDWLAYVWDVYPREQKWKTIAMLGGIISTIFLMGFTFARLFG